MTLHRFGKSRKFLIVLAVMTALPPPLFARMDHARELFQESMQYRSQNQYPEAERKMLGAIQEDPSNPEYHFELANIYSTYYDEAYRKKDKRTAKEMLAKAAGEFFQTAMLSPDYIPAIYNLGIVYKKQSEYEQARQQFREVLKLDPESIAAIMQIGAIYQSQGFFDEALDNYREAQKLDFFNEEIRSAIEDLDLMQGHYEEKKKLQEAREYGLLQRDFRYSPFSHARSQQLDREAQWEDGAGPVQAIPYLASLLVQQFMDWHAGRKETDDFGG